MAQRAAMASLSCSRRESGVSAMDLDPSTETGLLRQLYRVTSVSVSLHTANQLDASNGSHCGLASRMHHIFLAPHRRRMMIMLCYVRSSQSATTLVAQDHRYSTIKQYLEEGIHYPLGQHQYPPSCKGSVNLPLSPREQHRILHNDIWAHHI